MLEMHVTSQESEWSCMYSSVKVIDFASLYDFYIGFWKCSDTVILFCFSFDYLFISTLSDRIGSEALSECSIDDKHESPEINKIIRLIISHTIISIEINNIYFEISFTK